MLYCLLRGSSDRAKVLYCLHAGSKNWVQYSTFAFPDGKSAILYMDFGAEVARHPPRTPWEGQGDALGASRGALGRPPGTPLEHLRSIWLAEGGQPSLFHPTLGGFLPRTRLLGRFRVDLLVFAEWKPRSRYRNASRAPRCITLEFAQKGSRG